MDGISGILGLAWPALDSGKSVPVVTALFNQNLIPANLFGMYLSNGNADSDSEMFIGGADANHYTGAIRWISVTAMVWWTVNVQSAVVCGNAAYSTSVMAVLDSGTSFLLGPPLAITNIIASFQSAGVGITSYLG